MAPWWDRVRKGKEVKDLEEVKEVQDWGEGGGFQTNSADGFKEQLLRRWAKTNTTKDSTIYIACQMISL